MTTESEVNAAMPPQVESESDGITMPVQMIVLRLWEAKFSAQTIMDFCEITEDELTTYLPRDLWWYDYLVPCRTCDGRGHHRHVSRKPK